MRPSIDQARYQLSLKEMFVAITLLCVVLAELGAWMELYREALRRNEHSPGLAGGHPYWSTREGQRILAVAAERTRTEKPRRLRVYVGHLSFKLTVAFIVAWLAVWLLNPPKAARRLTASLPFVGHLLVCGMSIVGWLRRGRLLTP